MQKLWGDKGILLTEVIGILRSLESKKEDFRGVDNVRIYDTLHELFVTASRNIGSQMDNLPNAASALENATKYAKGNEKKINQILGEKF